MKEDFYIMNDGFIYVNPFFSFELADELNQLLKSKEIIVWKYKYSPKEGLDSYYCNGWTNKPNDLDLLCLTKSQESVKIHQVYLTENDKIMIIGKDSQDFRWYVELTKNQEDIYTIKLQA